MTGILLVDKPAGVTSHDVVDAIRKASGLRRVGHTGTLDPLATGLLILCLGNATRLSEFLTGLDKVYEGTMRLGLETDSYDLDGKTIAERPVPELTEATLAESFVRYTGSIEQVPPMVSAVKVGGERLYRRARKGETVERAPRTITIHEFTLLGYTPPDATFRVRCTRGTYVRSLCHEIGAELGCGGALAALRRTWVGPHAVANAAPVASFTDAASVQQRLIPLEKAVDLPVVTVRRNRQRLIPTGTSLRPGDITGECPVASGWVQVWSESGEMLALAEVTTDPQGATLQPKRVFCGQP
ncbi:MAG: tRNA pseudouridine(55) synthase TruB [Candidatus Hydrogenedentes bacterium]|nr:tRNA pseudouridine(55) synthase TruB [Candidatus Hydrogenedentota bacterium]